MAKDKRTDAQRRFDMVKHGWAFCNAEMLQGKLVRLEPIAAELASDDKRHETLATIREMVKP